MPNPTLEKDSNYRPDLDGLRSIAVLLVLVFHFNLVGIGKAGFIGVDVFFVISGFLISGIIWSQLDRGRFSLSSFYLRRFRRLAPAFICVQILLLGVGYLLYLPNDVVALIKQTFFAQTYLINFYLWRSVNYFGLQAHDVPLLHCWSLAVEEQFYLTYPLLLLGIHRFARRAFPYILIALMATSFALNIAIVDSHQWAAFYLLPTRAWELALGALLPFVQVAFRLRPWLRHAAALLGVAAIAAGVALYSPLTPFPGAFALYPTIGAAALILAGTGGGSWFSPFLSWRPMVYIGRTSYSLYLVHWPLGHLIESMVPEYTLGWRWFSFVASLGLSAVLFHLVEDPVRRGAVFPTARRFVTAYAVGFAAIMLIALSARYTGGWRFRYDPSALQTADYEKDQFEAGRPCEFTGEIREPSPACHLGAEGAKAEWLLVGDSHAWATAPAFSRYLKSKNLAGQLSFVHACMPIIGLGGSSCEAFTSAVFGRVMADPTVSAVVLASIWRQSFEGDYLLGPSNSVLTGGERIAVFKRQFAETVRRLRESGKQVIIWEAIPTAKHSVPKALVWHKVSHRPLDIAITGAEHERLFRLLNESIAENRPLIAATISPANAMCKNGQCVVESDGVPLYFDNNHPSLSSASYFAEVLSAQLAGQLPSSPF